MEIYKPDLYKILKRILSALNSQIVDHGDRVAYMFLKFAEYKGIEDRAYIRNMMLASFAHDIGAYKTDKFVSLLNFDVKSTEEHCIYGYLFMKYFSPLKEFAEMLLYHHTFYDEKYKYDSKYIDDGILVHLLDRIDIFSINHTENEVYEQLRLSAGKNFNPCDVEDFIAADKEFKILSRIRNNQFTNEVANFFNSDDVIGAYLFPLVDMLAYEIDFKSEQTVIHTITTASIATIIATKLALDERSIRIVKYAGRLHDLGKIKVPSEIVESPFRLTFEQYEEMKKHSSFTKDLIQDLVPQEVVDIAYKHHERLDGSGYPNHLTAESLTVSDRIVQVSDVASALIYKRSYKDAMEKEKVISILNEDANAGKLDKEIVKLFTDNYDDILKIVTEESKETIKCYENLQAEYKEFLDGHSMLHSWAEDFPLFSIKNS